MSKSEKLLFEKKVVANLYEFGYETPWVSARPEFIDSSLGGKLERLSEFRAYDVELEEMGLPDHEEEALWDKKLLELGLSHSELKLDKDDLWTVVCSDGKVDKIYSINYSSGVLKWRA